MAVGTADGHLLAESKSGATWTVVSIPDPGGGAQLNGLSCPSASACEAVGQASGATFAEAWNGSAWSIQATPNPGGASSSQLADVSCTSTSFCEAVGQFTSGGTTQTLAERWNGSGWAIQSTPNAAGSSSQLNGVSCPLASVCEAVGNSGTGTSTATLAEVWNGTAWAIQSTPNLGGSAVSELGGVSCFTASACMATGTNLAEHWNGTKWTLLSIAEPKSTAPPDLTRVSCTDKTRCMAVGFYFKDAIETLVTEQWTGSKWTLLSTPITSDNDSSGLSDVSCTFATACTGVGFLHDPNGPDHGLIEDWALRWQLQPPQIPFDNPEGSSIDSVSCPLSFASFCAGVGTEDVNGTIFNALAETWNGKTWTIRTTPNASNSNLDAVSCNGSKVCTAVGDVVGSGSSLLTLAERWDGTTWTVQPTPNPAGAVHSFLTAISCPSTKACVAVGFFTDGSGNQTPFAEHWDGTTWTIKTTPSPPLTPATQLDAVSCVSSTACEAVGTDTTQTWAEVWNGTSWAMQAIPSPSGGSDVRLHGVSCTAGNACSAVGAYFNGSKLVPLAERWNGTNWTVQPTAVPSGSTSQLSSVSCSSTPFNAGCMATGSVTKNGVTLPLAESSNLTTWSVKPTQSPDPNVTRSNMSSVSCSSLINCMGVGFYDTSLGAEDPLGEQWS